MRKFLLILGLLLSAQVFAQNWPQFRGVRAQGVLDGANLPVKWQLDGSQLQWKIPIPGLAHSCPVIWENRVWVTSAVSSKGESYLKPGLYGSGDADKDQSAHRFVLYCLDLDSGKTLWENVCYEGEPKEKRHIKSSYANATPVTNGEIVVAFFGSQGLYAFDLEGKLLWKQDVGVLNLGAYDAPTYEWGSASSPIIFENLVIVQCDTQAESFVQAFDLETGKSVWRVVRDELPSWATPTVISYSGKHELVTNSPNFIRGLDPSSGAELWQLGGSSKITAPTPFLAEGLLVVASGRRPAKPIFVLEPGGRGDLTLDEGQQNSEWIRWHIRGKGPYMPTPIAYNGLLFSLNNNGVLDCYDLKTGKHHYRQRVEHGGLGFSASPVASNGVVYFSSEDGDVFSVNATTNYELISKNPVGESIMATPALTKDRILVRARHHLFAIGK